MKKCQKCESGRIVSINGKTSDCFSMEIDGFEQDDYVPSDMNIGGGDYIEFDFCLECGQIQAEFPLAETDLEKEHKINEKVVEETFQPYPGSTLRPI